MSVCICACVCIGYILAHEEAVTYTLDNTQGMYIYTYIYITLLSSLVVSSRHNPLNHFDNPLITLITLCYVGILQGLLSACAIAEGVGPFKRRQPSQGHVAYA